MRTSRTILPHTRLLAATGAVLATLALTACQADAGSGDEGAQQPSSVATTAKQSADPSDTPSGTSDPMATPSATDTGDTSGSAPGSPVGASAAPDPNVPEKIVLCNGANTQTTVEAVTSPSNHLLITVRNNGANTCALTYAPAIRFDEMQWAPPPIEKSHPQAVVILRPGESGYAGVPLSAPDGSVGGDTTGHELTVIFRGKTPHSSGGPSAIPSLPAHGIHYDNSLAVTYWEQSRDDALAY
jgi:hypothetical protein